MDPRLANAIVLGLEVVAVAVFASAVYDTSALLAALGNRRSPMSFDSGRHYLVLMLIFPWFHLCGIISRKTPLSLKALSMLTAALFTGLAVGAWGSVLYVEHRFQAAGYVVCPGPDAYRVSPGEHRVYALREPDCRIAAQE